MIRAAAAAVAFLVSLPILAGRGASGRPAPGHKSPATVRAWAKQLDNADALLKNGDFGKAYKVSDRLLHTMCDKIVRGESAFPLMATAATLRAVLAVGR